MQKCEGALTHQCGDVTVLGDELDEVMKRLRQARESSHPEDGNF